MIRLFIVLFLFFLVGVNSHAQIAAECANAVPICYNTPVNGGTNGFGTDDFNGASSSGCLRQTTTGSIESNSAWYHFRTAASGQLGFNIGHSPTEDWDFALYQTSDCSNLGEPVRCNFFDNRDQSAFMGVGEDPTGDTMSLHYDEWLTVEPGQDYYLFINNFSNVNSGFSIQFSGDIFVTDPTTALDCSIVSNILGPPIAACENETVILDATTTGATGYTWYEDMGSGFQVISGATAATLQVYNDAIYRVEVTTPVSVGVSTVEISDVQVAFTTVPSTNPLSDEIFCLDAGILFDFATKDAEALGVQHSNDVMVSYYSTQADAINGVNPLPLQYAKTGGPETIYVRTSSAENPNCFDASQSFELYGLEIPDLTFAEQENLCDNALNVLIGEPIPNPMYTYLWDTGETTPNILATQEGSYTLTATNSYNGVLCASSRTVNVGVSATPSITDVEIDDLQVNNSVTILTDIDGDFEYRLGDGEFQSDNVFNNVLAGTYTITMRDIYGCGEVTDEIVVVGFSAHFSPNGDVLNENWHLDGLSALNSPIVTIYDRYGKLIKQLTEFSEGWDGTFNGQPMPATDYWFKLSYIDDRGNRRIAKYLQNHFSLRR